MSARGSGRAGVWLVALLSAGLIALSLWTLSDLHKGVRVQQVMLGDTHATLYRPDGAQAAPLVVVAHGFAGSRRMMTALSLTLAGSGFAVVAFDFIGHGRDSRLMSPDIGSLAGTTAQLVDQTRAVALAARGLPGVDAAAPMALLGHSMATDVVIRAAQDLPDVAAVVAISMYSDVVTPSYPERLLVISGEWEHRLREVGLRLVHMVDDAAVEGETARRGPVARRAVAAPHVEHVGVLYSPTTLQEARDWIAAAMGREVTGKPATTGLWMLVLMLGIVLAFVPVSRLFGPRLTARPLALRWFLCALALPVLPAAGAMVALAGAGTVAGFLPLTAFLAVWGLLQLALLWWQGWRPDAPRWGPLVVLLGWSLGFALVLDRVFSTFVPTGPRALLMAGLLIGTLPFALADSALASGAPLWRRVLLRCVVLVTLAGAMLAAPSRLGLIFTVLPVLVLFWLVFGSFCRWTGARAGVTTAALGAGLALAWSIAASTPLFALS